ncbi:MAG: ETC complex I subunit [Magnetospirillum sp. WYHS-4]
MIEARIFQPSRNAMQSGQANGRRWLLEFAPEAAKDIDPLMGWTGSSDTRQQVRMRFETRDQAVAFAERHGLAFRVEEPQARHVRPKNYADKFAWDRVS